MDKRGGGGGEREYHNSLPKIFCLTVPKNFVGKPFCAVFQKNSGGQKKFKDKKGGGEYQDFPSKFFCLTVPKHFVEALFCAVFQKISGREKVYR